MDYRLTTPIAIDGYADATGVYENRFGAWLGEVDGNQVLPYADEDGDYIPAPTNWQANAVAIDTDEQ